MIPKGSIINNIKNSSWELSSISNGKIITVIEQKIPNTNQSSESKNSHYNNNEIIEPKNIINPVH